jgi:hypothetical protein
LKEKLPCAYSLTRAKVENDIFPIKLKDLRRFHKFVKSDYQLHHVCPSVRLSVHMEQLGFHWTYFRENLYLRIF